MAGVAARVALGSEHRLILLFALSHARAGDVGDMALHESRHPGLVGCATHHAGAQPRLRLVLLLVLRAPISAAPHDYPCDNYSHQRAGQRACVGLKKTPASRAGVFLFYLSVVLAQYFGTDGSTSFDQAVMPPRRLTSRPAKPARCSASMALALRTPPLQCTTVSRFGSISFMRPTT